MIDSSPPRARPPSGGQICSLFAVDIRGFTSPERDDDIRRYLHRRLYEILASAFREAEVVWEDCWHEDRGDGVLVVVPPGIAPRILLHPLIERLRNEIRLHNHANLPAASLQLRVAIHIGPVDYDGEGYVGTDVNQLFRMLDSRPLKQQLASVPAELGLIVSENFYNSVVRRYPALTGPSVFSPIRFQAKRTRAKAWIYVPGLAQLITAHPDYFERPPLPPGPVSSMPAARAVPVG
jgi:hypothetical protein